MLYVLIQIIFDAAEIFLQNGGMFDIQNLPFAEHRHGAGFIKKCGIFDFFSEQRTVIERPGFLIEKTVQYRIERAILQKSFFAKKSDNRRDFALLYSLKKLGVSQSESFKDGANDRFSKIFSDLIDSFRLAIKEKDFFLIDLILAAKNETGILEQDFFLCQIGKGHLRSDYNIVFTRAPFSAESGRIKRYGDDRAFQKRIHPLRVRNNFVFAPLKKDRLNAGGYLLFHLITLRVVHKDGKSDRFDMLRQTGTGSREMISACSKQEQG